MGCPSGRLQSSHVWNWPMSAGRAGTQQARCQATKRRRRPGSQAALQQQQHPWELKPTIAAAAAGATAAAAGPVHAHVSSVTHPSQPYSPMLKLRIGGVRLRSMKNTAGVWAVRRKGRGTSGRNAGGEGLVWCSSRCVSGRLGSTGPGAEALAPCPPCRTPKHPTAH